MARLFVLVAILILALGLMSGCGPAKPAFESTDITGAAFGGNFQLTDHTGQRRGLTDYRGKVVVLFFGYTHCPDACPTTLSDLSIAMKQLGERAKQVQVLFVTVDPERDTPDLLTKYVPAFYPSFIGLTGSPQEIRGVADLFKVVYQKSSNGSSAKNYTVDHTAGSYILDKAGRMRLFVNYGAGGTVFAHDIGLLLAE